jgi:hypothetical protein
VQNPKVRRKEPDSLDFLSRQSSRDIEDDIMWVDLSVIDSAEYFSLAAISATREPSVRLKINKQTFLSAAAMRSQLSTSVDFVPSMLSS